jgi:hypothetical protein
MSRNVSPSFARAWLQAAPQSLILGGAALQRWETLFSREAAQECSPGRKPWVESRTRTKPRRGEREAMTQTPEGRQNSSQTLFRHAGFTRYPRTLATILLLALTAPFSIQAQKPVAASVTADLPAGPIQAKATAACLECHEARIILQQRLSKAAWTKEVDKMTKWGALVDPADRDALIDYLSTNFSPDQPPYNPQRTSDKGSSGKSSK